MCQHLNEAQTHPLELRVRVLENLLRDALAVLQAKARPGDECLMGSLIDEIEGVLDDE